MPLVFHQEMAALSNSIAGSFGFATAISANGKRAVIGASNFGAALGNGAAFYTDISDAIWKPIQLISDMHGKDFGVSVSISEDGQTILVGAPRYSDNFPGQGTVFSVTDGTLSNYFYASDPRESAFFGAATSISYEVTPKN